ncbi:MAG: DUF1207 domain-containing protein [Nitrospira sp.]|nr:DUF1207 domain-containing protein [Nitrospira sp.]
MTALTIIEVGDPATAIHTIGRTVRLLTVILAICLVLFETNPAWSRPVTDEYILGFATSVLRHEFNVIDATLKVHKGVIWINGSGLEGINQDKLKRALGGIEGVKQVVISETEESAAPAVSDDIGAVNLSEGSSGFLPRGLLFAPLHADPRWPHFSAAYRGYRTNDLTAAFAGTFGETFSLYRNRAPLGGQWELVLQAGVFSLFDLSATSLDLVNADYSVGVLTTYRSGNFSGFLRLSHQSSHLGDEFLLTNPGVQRINLSYEVLDVKLAYDLFSWIRVYAGSGYLVHRDPSEVEPLTTQWGIEWTSPIQFFRGAITPIGYADFQSNERSQWAIAQSIMAGLRFENARIGNRQLQLLAQYFAGPSPDGQFYTQHSHWFGVGLHFYF